MPLRTVAAALLIVSVGSAGPVGAYLGYAVGLRAAGTSAGHDSIHYFLPSPSDTVGDRLLSDTTTVLAETLIGAEPAWVIRTVIVGDSSSTSVDTAFESGDTMLRFRRHVADSLRWLNRYRVPFDSGGWWRTGLAGTYYLDVNADTLMDTLTIWADTSKVIDTATITVPYGTVPGCWLIRTVSRQALALTYAGVPTRETSYIRTWEWYKDSLCRVKDSTHISGSVHTQIIIWLRAANFTSRTVGQLTDLSLAISDHSSLDARSSSLVISPNPARSGSTVRLLIPHSSILTPQSSLSVFSSTGRLVLTLPCPPSAVFRLPVLPAGPYFLRLDSDPRVCRLIVTR